MSRTIMTVDDSPSIRQMVGFTLRQAGHRVLEAIHGADALAQLERQAVDLVITDLNMPQVNGLDLIRRIRALPALRFVPIVLLTTESDPARKMEARNAGATGWIVKPFTPDQLTAVVARLLR